MRDLRLSSAAAVRLFHGCGAASCLAVAMLAWQSRQPLPMALSTFGALCAFVFACSLLACFAVTQGSGRIVLRHVLLWCVALRLVSVLGAPIYEDDYFRYLWDGRQTVEQGSPYGPPPAAAFDTEDDPLWSEVLDQINHPEIPTIYGPVNQYAFALAYWIDPGNVTVLQVMFAAVDMLVIVLLARVAGLAPLVLYGFSPLVLKEFSFTAHPDILSVAGLVGATLLWRQQRLYGAALALAVAVSAKVFALLLVPLLLRWHWRAWAVFLAGVVLLHLPLGNAGGMAQALGAMGAGNWLFNAPIYYLLYDYVPISTIKVVAVLGLGALCAWYFFVADYHRQQPLKVPRGDVLFLALLLASPAFNPWYYVFPLAFAVIYPSAWAWAGSLTILFAYATGLQLGTEHLAPYQQPVWGLALAFVPILVAAVVRRRRPVDDLSA